AVGASTTGTIWLGLVYAAAAGLILAAVQANMSHRLTANQFVVGLTLNVLIVGLTAFLDAELQPVAERAGVVEIPVLSDIPLVGQAFFGQAWPAYMVYVAVPLAWFLMFRTRWGLELRACGENPQSADVSGIHVNRRRRQAIMFAGLCAGLGGGVLVLGQISISGYESGHVGLKGIIAIAAVIFGGWTLRGTIFGCLVFGYFFALQQTLPVLGYRINAQLAATLPYLVALIVTAAFAARTRQPRALAQPFVRGLT
ncbi:MAG TPA: ABC transporter permease, partial [Ilumatobacteraceae bacterium]|nr:ABC transporter permease [Ilumatobacteraceae bacterium]